MCRESLNDNYCNLPDCTCHSPKAKFCVCARAMRHLNSDEICLYCRCHVAPPAPETGSYKVGMLRQWLNEDRITDPKKMVTNEDLIHFLKAAETAIGKAEIGACACVVCRSERGDSKWVPHPSTICSKVETTTTPLENSSGPIVEADEWEERFEYFLGGGFFDDVKEKRANGNNIKSFMKSELLAERKRGFDEGRLKEAENCREMLAKAFDKGAEEENKLLTDKIILPQEKEISRVYKQIQKVPPIGHAYEANVYTDDINHIIHIWAKDGSGSYDITVSKSLDIRTKEIIEIAENEKVSGETGTEGDEAYNQGLSDFIAAVKKQYGV